MDAPTKIWAGMMPARDGWYQNVSYEGGTRGFRAEYILASEHARIVAEKDARIAELEDEVKIAYTRGFHDGQELVDKEVFEIVNSPDMRERDARIAELRGLMWYAWHEFNAIRARDGAPRASDWNDPKLVDEAYWSQLTDAFAAAIGEEATTPWPSPEARAALKGDDNG